VGVKFSNTALYAVATNLNYKWPAAPAVFSTGMAPPASVAGFGGTMTYSNALGPRFGGAASFEISGGDPSSPDLFPTAPVTLYLKIAASTPPCTPCVGGIILAKPTGVGAIGGPAGVTVMTPGGPVPATSLNPAGVNRFSAKLGLTPLGTIVTHGSQMLFGTVMIGLPTNMASSAAGPWTTGQVIIANPMAVPATETWTISGKDSRTAGGNGTIQMVSGSLSARPASGPNANRGWVRLTLGPVQDVPSMSPAGIAATIGLIVLAFGFVMRRRLFA
jgi:hypothetical protein